MTIGRINQRNVKQQIDRVPLHPGQIDYFDMTIGRINQRNVKQQIDRVPLHPGQVDYFDMTIGRINQRNVKQQIDRVPLHPVKTVKTTKTRMAASCRRGQTMQLQSIASRKQ